MFNLFAFLFIKTKGEKAISGRFNKVLLRVFFLHDGNSDENKVKRSPVRCSLTRHNYSHTYKHIQSDTDRDRDLPNPTTGHFKDKRVQCFQLPSLAWKMMLKSDFLFLLLFPCNNYWQPKMMIILNIIRNITINMFHISLFHSLWSSTSSSWSLASIHYYEQHHCQRYRYYPQHPLKNDALIAIVVVAHRSCKWTIYVRRSSLFILDKFCHGLESYKWWFVG